MACSKPTELQLPKIQFPRQYLAFNPLSFQLPMQVNTIRKKVVALSCGREAAWGGAILANNAPLPHMTIDNRVISRL